MMATMTKRTTGEMVMEQKMKEETNIGIPLLEETIDQCQNLIIKLEMMMMNRQYQYLKQN
jgi:hypothetical protein